MPPGIRRTIESKVCLRGLATRLRAHTHQAAKSSVAVRTRVSQPHFLSMRCQVSRLKTHHKRRWLMSSACCEHRAQEGSLAVLSMSPVVGPAPYLSWTASQRKNLCSGGAFVFHSSLAPCNPVWLTNIAAYADLAEDSPELLHLQATESSWSVRTTASLGSVRTTLIWTY
jgi:hypothetical protein